jgi:hypothetical protein
MAERMKERPKGSSVYSNRDHIDSMFRRMMETTGDSPEERYALYSRGQNPVPQTQPAVPTAVLDMHRRVQGWLSESFLAATNGSRFRNWPPVVMVVPSDQLPEFRENSYLFGSHAGGCYDSGSNRINMSDRARSEADLAAILVHEQLHYASWLGGGDGMRWRDSGGQPHFAERAGWLHEGLTEFHAQQITREHGLTPSHVGYPYETAVGFYLQKLVGADVLRQAYLTGDFTEAGRILDQRLGQGSLEGLMSCRNGSEALFFIMGQMGSANIDFTRWEREPIISRCFRSIAILDEGGGDMALEPKRINPWPFDKKEYAEARTMIDSWIKTLLTAGPDDAERISREKAEYFKKLKSKAPSVYFAMRSEDLTLTEIIHWIKTGKKIKY